MRPGRASATALLIARSTVISSRALDRRFLYDPLAVALSARFVEDHEVFGAARLWLYRRSMFRMVLGALERLTLPGIQLHYALRKRCIEDEVRAGLAVGYSSVQVFGAGFDTLAWRLAREFDDVRFTEVDHPLTQQAKTDSLGRTENLPANLSFQALDLALDGGAVPDAAPGADAPGDTIVVAEGVLMYLSDANVRRFFDGLRRRRTGRVRVIFTFMTPDAQGRIRFHNSSRAVDWWLGVKGEPFEWGMATGAIGGFLSGLGFELTGLWGHRELRARFLAGGPAGDAELAVGEWLAVAEAVR